MTGLRLRFDLAAACSLALLASCEGDGSDIGPRLERLPDASSKVLLMDDQNRGVVSATVSGVGVELRALTGRNGRGDFLAAPRGRVLFQVDPTYGSASDGDVLGDYRVALDVLGTDLPMALHAPDLPDDAAAIVATGVQAARTTITASVTLPGGVESAALTIPDGVAVLLDGANEARIALGTLAPQHLPGDLPAPSVDARLFSHGYYVGPAGATFSPGVDLRVPDELHVTSPNAQLFRLDTETGEWAAEQVSVAAAGGQLQVTGAITRGGLYAFGVDVAARALSGRVVDSAGDAVFEAMVRVDHLHTVTSGDGRFSVTGVPARRGDDVPRDAVVEVSAGGTWLPAVATFTADYSASALDVGDLELDTVRAGNVRVQQVVRARADGYQPARFSSLRGDVAILTTSDAGGQVTFEDVPAGFYGFQEARRRSDLESYYGQQVAILSNGQRWLDSYQFLFNRPWFQGTRNARAYVCDRIGGGPIELAGVVQGLVPEQGWIGETRESGQVFVDRRFADRATVTLTTARDGFTITHGFSYERPSSDHLEFPMYRVLRQPLGRFDRFGLVRGAVTGADPAAAQSVRVTRRITRQQLWDDVVLGRPLSGSLPVELDVADTQGEFCVGLPPAGGNLALVEVTSDGGRDTLKKAAVRASLGDGVVEGAQLDLGAPIQLEGVVPYTLTGALVDAPAEVDPSALRLSVGQAVEGAGVVDVARRVDGSLTAIDVDLDLGLPPLGGGAAWVAFVSGVTEAAGVTSTHHSMVDLAATETSGFRLQPFPTLSEPAPGASVAAAGFDVRFELPAGCIGGAIELRSETSEDRLLWEVLVRPEQDELAFVSLPIEAETPLVAGREYTLTVTAWFGAFDIESPDVFGDAVSYAQSIDLIEAGVRQVTSRTIVVTTN
jgi:hypothetical protein